MTTPHVRAARPGHSAHPKLEPRGPAAAVATAPSAPFIFELDDAGQVINANECFAALTGYRTSELLGRRLDELGETLPDHASLLAIARDRRAAPSAHVDGVATDSGGARQTIRWFAYRPLLATGGAPTTTLVGTPLAPPTAPEREPRAGHGQKLEAVGALASGIAHDFNNLLMGVSGCARVALHCLEPESSARMYLEEIRKSAETGAEITRQLLTLGCSAEPQPETFELNSAVCKQVPLLRRLLGEDIKLEVELLAKESRVRADLGQIDQVLMNLAVNARDAMPGGGNLRIETSVTNIPRTASPLRGAHSAVPPGSYVLLSVIDSGDGMNEETLERMFEPFFTTKSSERRSGLGLATVMGIVSQSDGYVLVDSQVGSGTRFDVYLPARGDEAITHPLEAPAPTPAEVDATILLCEDERTVRMVLRYYLERAGYRVLETENADEAIECCRRFGDPIDLFLTDVVLPGASGLSAAAAVQNAKPDAQVLFMSAHSAQWLMRAGKVDRELDLLQKPFDEHTLLAKVSARLGSSSADDLAPLAHGAEAEAAVRGTIIVAEDDRATRISLCEGLRQLGYEVLEAADGDLAVTAAEQHAGSLEAVIVDVVLPKRMGLAVARDIEMLRPGTSVIFTSGYPREIALQSDLIGPACFFAAKPTSAEAIDRLIRQAHGAVHRGVRAVREPSVAREPRVALIVEACATTRAAIAAHLALGGWQPLVAECAFDALRLLEDGSHRLDALVVDSDLPDLQGIEVAATIGHRYPGLAIVHLSNAGRSGAHDDGHLVLERPFDFEALSAALDAAEGVRERSAKRGAAAAGSD